MLATKVETFTVPGALPHLGTTSRRTRSALACVLGLALPVMMLSSFAATKSATLLHGKRICFETSLFDPIDVFRGNYAQLQFPTADASKFENGQQVFVTYYQQKGSKFWKSTNVSPDHPKLRNGEVCIKGTVIKPRDGTASIELPFAKVYLSAEAAKQLSSASPNPNSMKAEVAVDSSGDAVLTRLEAGGKVISQI